MIIKILRFLRGYVTFSAKGNFTERLINIISNKGMLYWDILPEKGGVTLSMPIKDYKNLHHYLYGKGIRTKIKSRHGLPFIKQKYKNRVGILVGGLLFAVILILLSNFIWIINVKGNNEIPDSRVIQVMRDNGFYEGVFSGSIDVKSLEHKIIGEIPEIRWMSINITGCKADIEIKEGYKVPKIVEKNKICNVKSKRDAVITEIRVSGGTARTKVGSAVIKGQLLISGVTVSEDGKSRLVHADGEVYGRTKYEKTFKVPKSSVVNNPTDNVMVRRRCNIFWLSFPLDFKPITYDVYKSITKKEALNINGTDLPLSLTEQYVTEMERKESSLKENKKALRQQASVYEVFNFKDKEIETRKENFYEDKNNYYLKINYTVIEELSETSEIIVQ
ncbi:MAG: sporulation protein YqfD [Ruminococcus sp.]|nr:sporulation protein YqfD [Ruminococcus sp.]